MMELLPSSWTFLVILTTVVLAISGFTILFLYRSRRDEEFSGYA